MPVLCFPSLSRRYCALEILHPIKYIEILDFLGENPHLNQRKLFSRRLPASERKALDILGASDTTTKSEIRKEDIYQKLILIIYNPPYKNEKYLCLR